MPSLPLANCERGFPPMLLDLKTDPDKLVGLGRDPAHAEARARMYEHLQEWSLRMSQRVTISDAVVALKRQNGGQTGVMLDARSLGVPWH